MKDDVSRGTTKVLREQCPLCSSHEHAFFMECKDHTVSHESFPIHACHNCGLRFTRKVPDENSIGAYYKSEDYVSHTDSTKGLINRLYSLVRNFTLQQKVRRIKKYTTADSVADFGAGTGYFVDQLRKNNIAAEGYEPDEDARSVAQNQLNLHLNTESDFYNLSDISTLTMWHVLEHVYDLKRFLSFISDNMNAGATWIFAVPNADSWDAKKYKDQWAAWDLPRHLYHFCPDQVEWICSHYNFELLQIIPMHFDAYYVSLLSEKYKGGNLLKALFSAYRSEIFAEGKNNSSLTYILRKK